MTKPKDMDNYENYELEGVRQQCKAFLKADKVWKKNAPKGKVYKGFKFKPFTSTSDMGFKSMGWRAYPVYERKINR